MSAEETRERKRMGVDEDLLVDDSSLRSPPVKRTRSERTKRGRREGEGRRTDQMTASFGVFIRIEIACERYD